MSRRSPGPPYALLGNMLRTTRQLRGQRLQAKENYGPTTRAIGGAISKNSVIR